MDGQEIDQWKFVSPFDASDHFPKLEQLLSRAGGTSATMSSDDPSFGRWR